MSTPGWKGAERVAKADQKTVRAWRDEATDNDLGGWCCPAAQTNHGKAHNMDCNERLKEPKP